MVVFLCCFFVVANVSLSVCSVTVGKCVNEPYWHCVKQGIMKVNENWHDWCKEVFISSAVGSIVQYLSI